MKNLFTILLSLLATGLFAQNATRITLISASATECIIRFEFAEPEFQTVQTPKGAAQVVRLDKATPLLLAGAPDLPKLDFSLQIPATGNMAWEILEDETQLLKDIEVAPSKGDLKRNVDPATVPYTYGPAYQSDAYYPAEDVVLQKPFLMRGVRGINIWVNPLRYNAAGKFLLRTRSMTLRVYHVDGTGENELKRELPPSRAFEDLYRNMFMNYATGTVESKGANLVVADKMLVLCADPLIETLQPLVEWKRQMGIHTTVVRMSEISGNDAASVYNFVKDYYTNDPVSYLLIVGDESAIRPQVRLSGGTNYSCDNCFGYMEGDDHYVEILVGRLHASTPDQMRVMVNRNLEYEKNPLVDSTENWCATTMWSASNEGQGIGDDGQADFEHANDWKVKHLADGFERFYEFYDGNHGSISPTPGDITADQDGNPTNVPLVELMNGRGVSLYNYTGHGWEQGLVSGNFNTSAVENLRNAHRYPLLIAVACCAGNFTANGGDCLGEAIQRAGNTATGEAWGAIGGYFSSDFQSWAPPMEGQDAMNQLLIDADGVSFTPTISKLLAKGNVDMIAAYAQGGEVMADFWNPFAEPSTVIRTRLPQTLTATAPAEVNIGESSLNVFSSVEGALVGLYWKGQTLASANISGGVAVLQFDPLTDAGDLTITVSQFNHIPTQWSIPVKPAAGPYVVNTSVVLDDLLGNNNQKADYGENVRFNVNLKNIGLETAYATSATLSTNDPNVLIYDDIELYGDLDTNMLVEKIAAFGFAVNDYIANGHTVNFTLTVVFNDTIETKIQIPVKLQAPVLGVGSITLNDASGNNNKRFDSGETVFVTIKNNNSGNSNSPNAIGTLSSSSPWLSINGPLQLGPIDADNGSKDAVFAVTVSPDAPQSIIADLNYQVNAGPYSAQTTFGALTINAIIESFESQGFTQYPWQQGGNKPWLITAASPYEGAYCSRSGTITHNQKSQMSLNMNVINDGIVSFAYRTSSEEGYDFLRFYIDNELMGEWSGALPWTEVSYPLSAGLHKITWSYEKDEFSSQGSDRVWVDGIILPAYQTVVATNAPQLSAEVQIAPNPFANETVLSINLQQAETLNIQITDLSGRTIRSINTGKQYPAGLNLVPLSFESLPNGLYLVSIRSEGGVLVRKVAKQ
ncbi:MAG: T9SS type A sorting domain-containing protein [Chitinophagales bacterium]|nr:T9SS type A sorting domain-containing protein [Chitinophagales bacterium]